MRKILKGVLTTLLALQIGVFMPIQANADFIGDVLDAAAQAGGWPSDLPSPTALIALIDIAKSCTDTSDVGLMNCVQQADANPVTHSLMGDSSEKIIAGIQIYIAIKNGDYLTLIEKLGKTAGCAAAAILTGVPVCALAELVAAAVGVVVDAVGEAGEFLGDLVGGALKGVDRLINGPPPASTPDEYYTQFYMPYLPDYYTKGINATVDANTPLQATVSESAKAKEVYWEQMYDLEVRSLTQIQQKCEKYYNDRERSQIASNCGSKLTPTFLAQASITIGEGKIIKIAGPAIQTILDKNRKMWIEKYDAAIDTASAELGQDASKLSVNFTKGVDRTYWLGKVVNAGLPNASGDPKDSVAALTLAKIRKDITQQPLDVLSAQLKAMQPKLELGFENFIKNLKEAQGKALDAELTKVREHKIMDILDAPSKKLDQIKFECNALMANKNKAKCNESQPLKACLAYRSSFWGNSSSFTSPIDLTSKTSQATFDQFIVKMQSNLDSCVTASQKVTDEWKRVSNIYPGYIKGWTDYCNATVNAPQKSDCNTTLGAYLIQAYDGCVDEAIEPVSKAASANVDVPMGGRKIIANPKGRIPLVANNKKPKNSLVIVNEQFCRAEGEAAVAQIDVGVFNNPNGDEPNGTPATIDPRRAASQQSASPDTGLPSVRGMRAAPGMVAATPNNAPKSQVSKLPVPSTVKSLDDSQNSFRNGAESQLIKDKKPPQLGTGFDLTTKSDSGSAEMSKSAVNIGSGSIANVKDVASKPAANIGASVAADIATKNRRDNQRDAGSSTPTTNTPSPVKNITGNELASAAKVPEPPFDRQLYQRVKRQNLESKWLVLCKNETCKSDISALVTSRINEVLQILDAGTDLRVKSLLDTTEMRMDVKYNPLMQAKVDTSAKMIQYEPESVKPVGNTRNIKIKNY